MRFLFLFFFLSLLFCVIPLIKAWYDVLKVEAWLETRIHVIQHDQKSNQYNDTYWFH